MAQGDQTGKIIGTLAAMALLAGGVLTISPAAEAAESDGPQLSVDLGNRSLTRRPLHHDHIGTVDHPDL